MQNHEKQGVNESDEDPQIPLAKNIIRSKVKNPLGGNNPQLSVKGKKVTKPTKNVTRKDKGITKAGSIKDLGDKTIRVNKRQGPGKENTPSSSTSSFKTEGNKAEEEAMLAYMKAMYQTHGENLLNKFKSMEPIRNALGHIDNNEKTRNESLKKKKRQE